MRRVIFNQKGGVGKSSITCNLAAISATKGLRTLVIDLDHQCNSSQYLGCDEDSENTVADLLGQTAGWFGVGREPIDFVQDTAFENLKLIAASPRLQEMEQRLESRYKMFKLQEALDELEEEFDQIYIDTPPAYNFFTKSALIAANSVLIPFDCDCFSRRAIDAVLENIAELRNDHNKGLELHGLIINQFNAQARFPKELVNELLSSGLPVLDSYLSSSVKMKESHFAAKPMIYMYPKHKLTQQLVDLHGQLKT